MSDAQLVNDWLAQHGGARRFPTGTTAQPEFMGEYLASKGVVLRGGRWSTNKGAAGIILTERGRSRQVTLRTFLKTVDTFRVADGLEPILGQSK